MKSKFKSSYSTRSNITPNKYFFFSSTEQERLIKDYVISIFALKLVDIAHLLFCQMTVDLFLIDWEQPKPGIVNERNTSGQINPKTGVNSTKDMAVSVWRTYLVANEWNEIQTVRKISHSLQIILVVLVLHVSICIYLLLFKTVN